MLRVVRARIYHGILEEIYDLIAVFTTQLNNHKKVELFERSLSKKVGVKYAKVMPFARYALYEVLKYKNFPKDSEIIMPPITIKPMIDIVLMLGLKPIFVDIELDTFCYNDKALKKVINKNTKAIFITYLFGLVPNMDSLMTLCKNNNLFIVEDFSHTINATWRDRNIGTFGDVAIYSSSSLKTIDTYMGGTTFTEDKDLYDYLNNVVKDLPKMPRIFLFKKILLNLLRNMFSKSIAFTFVTNPLLFFLKNINNDFYKQVLGARLKLAPVNSMPKDWMYKFTSLQASRGLKQLKVVDKFDKERIFNVNSFNKVFDKDNLHLVPKQLENSKNVYWQYPIFIDKPDSFTTYMKKYKVDMGLTNLSLCSQLDIYPKYTKDTPNAAKVKEHYFFVPTYSGLSENKVKYIAQKINFFLRDK